MDILLVKDIIVGIGAVLGAVLGIWAFIQSPSKKNAEAIDKVLQTMTVHDQRLQQVELEMKHLPTQDSVMELKLAMTEIRGAMGRMDEQIGSVGRTVHRIDDYLRSKGGSQ